MEYGARGELTRLRETEEVGSRKGTVYQLILMELYWLLIESSADDFSCLPPQLLECSAKCCQINWC